MTTQTKIAVTIEYFKPSGKWYSSAEGEIPDNWYLLPATRENLFGGTGPLPGLCTRGEDFFIYVAPKDGGPPILVMPEV